MPGKNEFKRTIEEQVGEPVENISRTPIDERRKMNERKFNSRMIFQAFSNFIGRGSVLRRNVLSRDEVEKELDKALRK